MGIRAVYVFDVTLDVRYVEGFGAMFDLTLLSPGGPKTTNESDLRVHWEVLPRGRLGFILRGSRWLIRHRSEYDLVFALDNLTAALAANIAGLFTRKPVILVLLKPTVDYYKCRRLSEGVGWRYWLGLAAVKSLVFVNERLAAASAPCSQYIADQTRSRLVTVIPSYGVDTDGYTARWSQQEARHLLDLPAEPKIIFCRSRIGPEKDPETFVRAVARLRADGRDVIALYVGGEYRDFIELASGFELPIIARDHVHPIDELPSYYTAADVAVQTSKSEGLGLSPLESLCCGVPVVVSATGGLLETIVEKETGMLSPVGDADSVASQIAWLLDHPEEGKKMAERGRRMVEERYSAKQAFAAWATLADRVLNAKEPI